ncbi:MAG: ATP-binding protein [Bacteroidetes bacterium]|nr:MAG: ATP-binding protein [Bacteroidota bacterium]
MKKSLNLPVIKFEQSWGGVEWISRQKYDNGDIDEQLNSILVPNEDIISALSSMFKEYYPNDLLNKIDTKGDDSCHDTLPWIHHKFLYESYSGDTEKYKQALTKVLTNDWILSWHWRAVLPTLKQHNIDKNKVTIIQICHFRKWEMLLCFSIDRRVLNSIKSLKEIPLKNKNLLRSPLFGISHRLKGWDTYRLFYNKKTQKYINNSIKAFNRNPLKLDYSTILGRHDCYYIIEDVKQVLNGFEWTLRCELETEPEKLPDDILNNFPIKRPLDFVEIPAFDGHDGIPQLLSSDNYCEAIYEVTEVLNDHTAKSVLLIAPPGSGKEKLAEFAFHCRESNKRGEFIATTFAGLDATEVSKLLFTIDKISEDFNIERYSPKPQDGLILRALDGALFIDEIDKADRSVRDLLLRVLESGEITEPNTSRIINIKKRKPLYIFSGSMGRKSMLQEPPSDFWTRISHIVEVSHPLAIEDLDKSKKVVKDYLWMFWSNHVKDFMKTKLIQLKGNHITKPLLEYNEHLYGFLINEKTVNFVCDILAEELSGRGKPLISIRTLRSIVARSLFRFIDTLQFAKFDNEPIEIYKIKHKNDFKEKSFSDWFNELLKIVSIDFLEKQIEEKNINSIELNVLESFKYAIRMGIKSIQ